MDYTIVAGDDGKVITVDTRNEPASVTLPAPTAGFKVTIKDIGGNASVNKISILRNGSELIDGFAANTELAEDMGAISLISDGTNWSRIDALKRSVIQNSGRALFAGGFVSASNTNTIDFVTISTLGNFTDFGDLTAARRDAAASSSSTRALFAGGFTASIQSVIDYVQISTQANAQSFGNLSVARRMTGGTGCGSPTRGLWGGGDSGSNSNVIDYVTIATLGNAADFGDLTAARSQLACHSSSVRGIWGGGSTGVNVTTIDFVTIATLGNATSFGALTAARSALTSSSNPIRGLFIGGAAASESNIIEYVTIATAANAIDFGDLEIAKYSLSSCSSHVRALIGGGHNETLGSSNYNIIDYVAFASLTNTSDFGDLSGQNQQLCAASSSHGGLYV